MAQFKISLFSPIFGNKAKFENAKSFSSCKLIIKCFSLIDFWCLCRLLIFSCEGKVKIIHLKTQDWKAFHCILINKRRQIFSTFWSHSLYVEGLHLLWSVCWHYQYFLLSHDLEPITSPFMGTVGATRTRWVQCEYLIALLMCIMT